MSKKSIENKKKMINDITIKIFLRFKRKEKISIELYSNFKLLNMTYRIENEIEGEKERETIY